MRGLARAEWLRFRGRRSLQVIFLAVPLLVAFFFVTGYASTSAGPPPFDAQAVRERLISEGVVNGLPPDQAETILGSLIDGERQQVEFERERARLQRAPFAFPQSLVTALASGSLVFFALILLTATSIGDEFGWGTIRTSLLASSHRRRMLLVRLGALVVIAVGLFALLLLIGAVMPLLLAASGATLVSTTSVDVGALLALLLGELVIALVVIGFAALATLLVRSGGLTLVVMLVYVAVEAGILAVLARFEPFQAKGAAAWVVDALPVHGLTTLTNTASLAASGVARFPGELVSRDLAPVGVPFVALLAWGAVFVVLAFRRFTRMDIVE